MRLLQFALITPANQRILSSANGNAPPVGHPRRLKTQRLLLTRSSKKCGPDSLISLPCNPRRRPSFTSRRIGLRPLKSPPAYDSFFRAEITPPSSPARCRPPPSHKGRSPRDTFTLATSTSIFPGIETTVCRGRSWTFVSPFLELSPSRFVIAFRLAQLLLDACAPCRGIRCPSPHPFYTLTQHFGRLCNRQLFAKRPLFKVSPDGHIRTRSATHAPTNSVAPITFRTSLPPDRPEFCRRRVASLVKVTLSDPPIRHWPSSRPLEHISHSILHTAPRLSIGPDGRTPAHQPSSHPHHLRCLIRLDL